MDWTKWTPYTHRLENGREIVYYMRKRRRIGFLHVVLGCLIAFWLGIVTSQALDILAHEQAEAVKP